MNAPAKTIEYSSVTEPSQYPSLRNDLGNGFRNLYGFRVCHVSPVSRRDDRAFGRESLPFAGNEIISSIIGPHGENGYFSNVKFVPVRKIQNRAFRFLFASRVVVQALEQRADLYHIHGPEHIPAGLILKFLFRKRVVYDTREDFPAMMLTKTYLPIWLRKFAKRLTFRAELLASRCFDGFITADPGTMRQYARNGKSKKLVFYNLPNLQFYPEPLSQEKEFDLVYRGGLSERAGTFVLLEALKMLSEQGVAAKLLMFGYTDDERTRLMIKGHIRKLQLEEQVTLKGIIHHVEMAATLSRARIAVCPLQRIPKFLNNIPVKVFESWACGLPVVASDLPPIRPFFRKNQHALLFRPDDPVQLADVIRQLLSDPGRITRLGREARIDVVERYNNRIEARKLLSFYRRVVTG